jgi:hypothetical protein
VSAHRSLIIEYVIKHTCVCERKGFADAGSNVPWIPGIDEDAPT